MLTTTYLTGLANRSLLLERVAQYMRSNVSGEHRLALFLIDLERFENINDCLGRPAGDALLRQVAEWLTRYFGDANLLARVGADVFAVMLLEIKQDVDVAQLLENAINAFLVRPFRLDNAVFRVGAKVGVALFPEDCANAETLFKNTEAAVKHEIERQSLPVLRKENDRNGGCQAHPGKSAAPGAR